MNTETEATVADEKKTIIPEKYRGKYAGAQDWLSEFINEQATVAVTREKKNVSKAEDGTETVTTETVETGKRSLDIDKLIALAKANHVDTSKLEAQSDRPNFAGRARMTWGNSLRAAAKNRHGLYNLNGDWVDAPAEFLGDAELKQNRDGTKIAKAKPASTDSSAGDGASTNSEVDNGGVADTSASDDAAA